MILTLFVEVSLDIQVFYTIHYESIVFYFHYKMDSKKDDKKTKN